MPKSKKHQVGDTSDNFSNTKQNIPTPEKRNNQIETNLDGTLNRINIFSIVTEFFLFSWMRFGDDRLGTVKRQGFLFEAFRSLACFLVSLFLFKEVKIPCFEDQIWVLCKSYCTEGHSVWLFVDYMTRYKQKVLALYWRAIATQLLLLFYNQLLFYAYGSMTYGLAHHWVLLMKVRQDNFRVTGLLVHIVFIWIIPISFSAQIYSYEAQEMNSANFLYVWI